MIEDPELGLDFSRVVHGDQKFEFTRPISAGDVLTTTASVAAAHTRAGNDFLTIRSDVTDQLGAPSRVGVRNTRRTSGGGLSGGVQGQGLRRSGRSRASGQSFALSASIS